MVGRAPQRNFALDCDRLKEFHVWNPGAGPSTRKQDCIAAGVPWKHGDKSVSECVCVCVCDR